MILTPIQYIKNSLVSYPSLYKSNTENDMKMKIFNQLFNTIGNGINDNNLAEHLNIKVKSQTDLDKEYKFILNNNMYQVFDDDFVIFINDIFKTKETLKKYPKSRFNWEEVEISDCSLYPNFQAQYSIAYSSFEIFKQSKEWIETIIWFYTKAQNILLRELNDGYKKENIEKDIADYSYIFKSETYIADKNKTHFEKISEAYKIEFDGDIKNFIIRRNNKVLRTRIEFCKTILEMYKN
jgi:hypothetical protein